MASIANSVTLPCGFTLPNRLVKAAMAEQMADSTNLPNEDFKRVYQNWAKGGWGMVITGNVQVDPAYLGSPKDLSIDSTRLSDPAYQKVWKDWAQSCAGSPTIVQINHPGRQSPMGAGTRSMSAKTVAPSAIPLDFGPGLLQRGARNMVFGTPRALSTQEVEDIITQFVQAAKFCYDSGFDGVEIHAAHGYLLAQFLSKAANRRDDEFGGDAGKRAEIIVRIIKRVREATSPGFVIGMKMNSVDVKGSGGSEEEALEQVARFWGVGDGVGGLDFLEISGGTYEEPEFLQTADEKPAPVKSASTAEREAFFLKFASLIRSRFPSIPLIVTGGFRSLSAMNQAVESKQCDFIGLGRPAAIAPLCPKTLLGVGKEEKLVLEAPTVEKGWWMKAVSIKVLGAGAESDWYAQQIQKLGK